MICRLRLWVELLKHAYFKADSQYQRLETLPNIDINIKTGNSLISRFALEEDLKEVFAKGKIKAQDYRLAVAAYKNASDKTSKAQLLEQIGRVKSAIYEAFYLNNPFNKKLKKLLGDRFLLENKAAVGDLFEKLKSKDISDDLGKLNREIGALETQIEELKQGKTYRNSFEWRFEFPEVLDDEGKYVGFDVVVGNPPYGVKLEGTYKSYSQSNYKATTDIYTIFIERAFQIVKSGGYSTLIVPIFWQTGDGYLQTRKFIKDFLKLEFGIILPYDVFEEAYVDTGIYCFKKESDLLYFSKVHEFSPKEKIDLADFYNRPFFELQSSDWTSSSDLKISFNATSSRILHLVKQNTIPLQDISDSARGILATSNAQSLEPHGEEWKPFFDGKLNRYLCESPLKYVKYTDELPEKPRSYEFFTGSRILVRRIVSRQFRIMATLVEEEFVSKKDLYCFKITNKDYLEEYLLALINSKLFSYLKTSTSNAAKKDDFTQLTLKDIRDLPIKVANMETQQLFASLVTRILTAKQADKDADTGALEAEVDRLVYGLYGLTEEEVKIIES
jgi:hypothetical protein